MARSSSPAPKRVYVRVTSWRRRRFLVLLAECGNVRAAAELAGVGIGAVYRLRKKEPAFAAQVAAAKAEAAAYDDAFEGEPLDEHDVERAIRTLEHWDRQEKRRARGRGATG